MEHPTARDGPTSITSRIADWLVPGGRLTRGSAWAFLAGLIVTFVALSLLGRSAGTTNHLGQLPRWHPRVSPQAFYYPTASEGVARAVDGLRSDQVVVVIGGSSVMRGGMQGLNDLWSAHLQRELGDGFRVVNVAQPSGQIVEHGGVLLQALLMQGYRAILVGDLLNQVVPQPDGIEYRYVYWDARYKGMLPHNPRIDDRIAVWSTRIPIYAQATPNLQIRALLDSQLRFADLWNAIGYTTMFTVWSPVNAPLAATFRPRRDIPDFDTIPLAPVPNRFQAIPPREGSDLITQVVPTVCRQTGPETWVDDDQTATWQDRMADAEAAFPDEVKPHVLLVLTRLNPWFGQTLSADQRRCHDRSYGVAETWMGRAGYSITTIGADWTDEDFADRLHLSPQGARKLASAVAPLVTGQAARLGYTARASADLRTPGR